jgi:hypothetical protein
MRATIQISNHKNKVTLHLASQNATGNPPKTNFEVRDQNLNFDSSLSLTKQGIKSQVVKTDRCDQKKGTVQLKYDGTR